MTEPAPDSSRSRVPLDPNVRPCLTRQLQEWRRAGLRFWMRTGSHATASVDPGSESSGPAAAAPPLPSTITPTDQDPQTVPASSGKRLAAKERAAALEILSQRVAACTRCQELAETRTQTVFGVGDPSARVMFVGEAPGADEDRLGEPFVGRAGQLLDKIIEACQLRREDIYICNVLRCRPPENRNPSATEAANCREFLDGQIEIVDPDYIVCWGTVAAQNLLNTNTSIGKLRGEFHSYGRARVLCTYHPSYLLRNPSAKKPVWEDMQLLLAELGIEV